MKSDTIFIPTQRADFDRAKALHPGRVILFPIGDFYELFFEDAQAVANTLKLTLTKTRREGVPMCGFVKYNAEKYIAEMLRNGMTVAIWK